MIIALSMLGAAQAQAPKLRVVVVPKVTADGQTRDAAALEAWVHAALKASGHRVVDLDSALRAQSFALSDAVAAGKIPDSLSVLNADAAWAVQLNCDKDAGHAAVMGLSFYCTFTRKVVRIGQGDSVYSATEAWKDVFGTNFSQALFGGNVKKRAPGMLAADVTAWSEAWSAEGPWDVDLKVSGIVERAQAQAIATRLAELPGVESTRLAAFSTTVSQFTLHGEGAGPLGKLSEHIEGDPGLGLRVTHDADRLLHAEVDLGRMHRRGVRVRWTGPRNPSAKSVEAVVGAQGEVMVRSALANLGWMSVTELGADSPKEAATKAKEPYFVEVSLQTTKADGGKVWSATVQLSKTESGTGILTGSGRHADPLAALDAAARDLDTRFLGAVQKSDLRQQLGLPASLGEGLTSRAVQIASVDLTALFPSGSRYAQTEGVGVVAIDNQHPAALEGATLELRAQERVLASIPVPAVPAGESVDVPLVLSALPALDADTRHSMPVTLTLAWEKDGSFGRHRAYSSLLVHRRNTVDWRTPESVAAFVDGTDTSVRDLATSALQTTAPKGATAELVSAATVHGALWGKPLTYVKDPVQTSFAESIDEVQHPRQTLDRLSGDCDDLTVLLASLYEAVGLSTVIITTPGHVLVGVDSGLLAGGELLLGLPADRFIDVDGALFVPVETTALDADFLEAWERGAKLVSEANEVRAFRTRRAWRLFPTMGWSDASPSKLKARQPERAVNLPALVVPKGAPQQAHALSAGVLTWISGNEKKGMAQSLQACGSGIGEGCFNVAVMLAAARGENEPVVQRQLQNSLTLLDPRVMEMLMDDRGGGMASDQAEDSEQSETQRRLAEVLAQARAKQAAMAAEAKPVKVETTAMAGRRGAPEGDARELATLFFYAPASAD